MMRYVAAILAVSLSCSGASCPDKNDPPSAVKVYVEIPVPCKEAVPECQAPKFDAARAGADLDENAKLAVGEMRLQGDCLERTRKALMACRAEKPGN